VPRRLFEETLANRIQILKEALGIMTKAGVVKCRQV
jgi:hypothetical protein